jgi:hypothetical protein
MGFYSWRGFNTQEPASRGSLWGGYKGIKPESNTFREQPYPVRSAAGLVDFYDKLWNDHRQIIRELLDLEKFKTVKIGLDTLCWDNGVDFAPEYLYEQIMRQKAA